VYSEISIYTCHNGNEEFCGGFERLVMLYYGVAGKVGEKKIWYIVPE
jgi:hypothetical protein